MDGLSCDTSPKAQQTYKTTAFWLVWNLALDTFHHKESDTKAIGILNIQWAENPKSKTAKGAGHGLQSQFDVQSQCSCGKFAPKTKLQTLQCMLPRNVILDHLHLLRAKTYIEITKNVVLSLYSRNQAHACPFDEYSKRCTGLKFFWRSLICSDLEVSCKHVFGSFQ